ncbi:unnamed protein product, partial [Iphiclides podalirius]
MQVRVSRFIPHDPGIFAEAALDSRRLAPKDVTEYVRLKNDAPMKWARFRMIVGLHGGGEDGARASTLSSECPQNAAFFARWRRWGITAAAPAAVASYAVPGWVRWWLQCRYNTFLRANKAVLRRGGPIHAGWSSQRPADEEMSGCERLQLLSSEELGDRKPSQFLRHLRSLGGNDIPDDFLRSLWSYRLPNYIQAIIATQDHSSLDEVAQLADKIVEVTPQTPLQQVAATSTPLEELHKKIDMLTQRLDAISMSSQRYHVGVTTSRNIDLIAIARPTADTLPVTYAESLTSSENPTMHEGARAY